MADIARNLTVLFDGISKTKVIEASHVVYLMAKSRQYIEEKKRYGDLPVLSFFCNWTLHVSISEAPKGMKMMRDLALVAADYSKTKDVSGKHNDKVCEIISIRELRKDFLKMTTDLNIPNFVFSTKNIWDAFVGMLMRELIEKPVVLVEPNGSSKFDRLKKIYDEILVETMEIGFVPSELKFSSEPGKNIQWVLTPGSESPLKDTYAGILYFTEQEEDF